MVKYVAMQSVIPANGSNKFLLTGPIKMVAIQAAPGTIFFINEEKILMGKRGIYELYDERVIVNKLEVLPSKYQVIIDYRKMV